MNKYKKFCPNVFVAVCSEEHSRGEIIEMTTRYGDTHEVEVYNLVGKNATEYFYSVVRVDGINKKERAKNKAERLNLRAEKWDKKSDEYLQKSQKHKDFLSLGEPIKVGHHSEKWHRKVIKESWDNLGRSVESSRKAEALREKADYWESTSEEIDLSLPESLEYYSRMLEKATEYHSGLKSGKYPREHAFSLTYAKKNVNKLAKKVDIAKLLWGCPDD